MDYLVQNSNTPKVTMSSREIAELVQSRHDNVKTTVDRLVAKGVIQLPSLQEVKNHLGQTVSEYQLGKRDSLIVVAQLCPEFTAAIVDRWQELEEQVRIAMPDFSNPALAARAWADMYEAKLLSDKTKAEIGSRREATAMNTASQAVKKANRLEIELDQAKTYATVKRMQMIYHGQRFDWRLLRELSANLEQPAIDVFDQNYGTVKAYHADVWQAAYALGIEEEMIA